MKEFYSLLEHLKSLYETGLYEDVKILSDLLIGTTESSLLSSPSLFSSASTSSSSSINSLQNSSSGFNGIPFQCDSKDKYMIFYCYGNAAFNLREYKLAESLFNKALQINKTNLKPKPKNLASLVRLLTYQLSYISDC